MKLVPITTWWTPLVLEEGFQGTVLYTIQGKTVTIRLTGVGKQEGPALYGSRKIATLPIGIRPGRRTVQLISSQNSLNILARLWADGSLLNLMPGLNTTDGWKDDLYSGQISYTLI